MRSRASREDERRTCHYRRGGAPTKEMGGLTRVLYVRVSPALLKRLDRARARLAAVRKGSAVSRADAVRLLLWDNLGELML